MRMNGAPKMGLWVGHPPINPCLKSKTWGTQFIERFQIWVSRLMETNQEWMGRLYLRMEDDTSIVTETAAA